MGLKESTNVKLKAGTENTDTQSKRLRLTRTGGTGEK